MYNHFKEKTNKFAISCGYSWNLKGPVCILRPWAVCFFFFKNSGSTVWLLLSSSLFFSIVYSWSISFTSNFLEIHWIFSINCSLTAENLSLIFTSIWFKFPINAPKLLSCELVLRNIFFIFHAPPMVGNSSMLAETWPFIRNLFLNLAGWFWISVALLQP